MIRLAVDWFSRQPPSRHPLSFLPGSRWYSEALLRTQFRRRRGGHGNEFAESFSHADVVIGDLESFEGRGDVRLTQAAKQLVVVEAKMSSGLSKGTRRALTYDQASRNVACIAETMAGRAPESVVLGFVIAAPEARIDEYGLRKVLTSEAIRGVVGSRVDQYLSHGDLHSAKLTWLETQFIPVLNRIALNVLSWESIIDHIGSTDGAMAADMNDFYNRCLQFNQPRRSERAWPLGARGADLDSVSTELRPHERDENGAD